MAQEVFKRTELKYRLEKGTYERLIFMINQYVEKDRYFDSEIMSLYYDTPDYYLIRTSMEKPAFKEKIRLRTYGVPDDDSTAFLEYKRKYGGVVYKRRTFMALDEMLGFLDGKETEPNNPQIERELKYGFEFYKGLAPKMLITYHRNSYFAKEDPALRITFDDRIMYRGYDLDLRNGIYGRELLEEGQRLMEIKIAGAMPLWLARILSELKVYPTSFSKYGTAYATLLSEGRLDGNDRFSADNIRISKAI